MRLTRRGKNLAVAVAAIPVTILLSLDTAPSEPRGPVMGRVWICADEGDEWACRAVTDPIPLNGPVIYMGDKESISNYYQLAKENGK